MKKILFIACLLTGASIQGQIKSSSIKKGVSIKTQPSTPVTQTTILEPENSFSNLSKMNLKLPFSTVEKEYMVQKEGHFYVLNGDIIVGNDFPRTMSRSSDDLDHRWPLAIIPYVVDQSIYTAGLNKIVFDAIAEFNGRTKLCLVRRTNQEDYVKIVFSTTISGAGRSRVGRGGGEQPLFLAASADKETVMHEMMHAAGFYHEQCRDDRDQFVKINTGNILKGSEHNFQVEGDGINRTHTIIAL